MEVVSICNSEEYYYTKNIVDKDVNKNMNKNVNKNKNVNNNVNKKVKNIIIKKNGIYSGSFVKIKKNKVKHLTSSKDYDTKNKVKNKEDISYAGKEEYQLEFELSLDDIENSFNEDSLDLFKYDQMEYFEDIEDNYEDYKPQLNEEEQLEFELTMEEVEDSFNKLSLDLFKCEQLDCNLNNIDIEAQAYENIVELEFEYSDDE